MIREILDRLAGKPSAKRSPHWPAVEKAHLKEQPTCQVCGGKQSLNVHHRKPYHLFPELELDDANLITLCNAKRCHITFGHCGDFKAWNPCMDNDVQRAREMLAGKKYTR